MDYSHLEDQGYETIVDEGRNAANAFSKIVDRLEGNMESSNERLSEYAKSLMQVHDGAAPYIELFKDWENGQLRDEDDEEIIQKAQSSEKIHSAITEYEQTMARYMRISEELERRDVPHPEPHHLVNYDFDLDRFKSEVNLLQNSFED